MIASIDEEITGNTTVVQTQWVGYATAGELEIKNAWIISGIWLDTGEVIAWPWMEGK